MKTAIMAILVLFGLACLVLNPFFDPFRWRLGDLNLRGLMVDDLDKRIDRIWAGKTIQETQFWLGDAEGHPDNRTLAYQFMTSDPLDASFVLLRFHENRYSSHEVDKDGPDYRDPDAFDQSVWSSGDKRARGKMVRNLSRMVWPLVGSKDAVFTQSLLGEPDAQPLPGRLIYRFISVSGREEYLMLQFQNHRLSEVCFGDGDINKPRTTWLKTTRLQIDQHGLPVY